MATARNDGVQHPTNCRRAFFNVDEVKVVSFDKDSRVTQSSELIVRCAAECLENHPHFRGRAQTIQFKYIESKSVLRLEGRLPSYFLKQLLQAALRDLECVKQIQNDVEVINPSDPLAGLGDFERGRKNDEQE